MRWFDSVGNISSQIFLDLYIMGSFCAAFKRNIFKFINTFWFVPVGEEAMGIAIFSLKMSFKIVFILYSAA